MFCARALMDSRLGFGFRVTEQGSQMRARQGSRLHSQVRAKGRTGARQVSRTRNKASESRSQEAAPDAPAAEPSLPWEEPLIGT